MRQAAEIVWAVVRGFTHVTRLSLYRRFGVPYPWLRVSGNTRFRTDEVWPQPSPISPKLPYAVLHLPAAEIREFLLRIVSRFQRQVAFSWLAGIRYLGRRPHLDCPDDATFARYLTTGVYGYFLTDVLDDVDRELLARNGLSVESVQKSDLTPVSTVDPFPGLYCNGSVCYFRDVQNEPPEPIGIAMIDRQFRPGELIRPSDGGAWKRAKMHVLQGATYLSLFVTHPKCHFPVDAIIAVTRTRLPGEHRIHRLLAPHMYLQLPLDYSVLHIKNGPGYNDPRLYYTAFSGAGRSQYRLFEYSFAGFPGHAAFEPYAFGHVLRARKNDYVRFLLGYREVILGFVRRVIGDAPIDDTLRQWMDDCRHYSRGFGVPGERLDHEQLAQALATLIWNCTVVHTADHFEFHALPMEHKPTRLRIPPPLERGEYTFDPKDLTQPSDRLRHYMWHELYMRPWVLERLCEVDYRFAEPEMQAANRDFLQSLAAYESSLGAHPHVPLREIASSIHW